MRHVGQDELLLHHYGEAGAEPVADHLTSCAECRSEYDRLRSVLGALDAAPVPRRSESYPQDVWRRVSTKLDEDVASHSQRWLWLTPRRLSLAATLAGLLVAAFLLGRYSHVGPWESTGPVPAQVRERILLVAVGEHLERSQRLLVELLNAEGNGTVDIGAERERAEQLALSNRIYRQTASRSGDELIAEFLDELERVLLDVANGPSHLASAQLEDLRKRIAKRGILFRIRVIGENARQRGASGRRPASEV